MLITHVKLFELPIYVLLRLALYKLVESGQLINKTLVLQGAIASHIRHPKLQFNRLFRNELLFKAFQRLVQKSLSHSLIRPFQHLNGTQ